MSTPVDPRDTLVASPHWELLPGMRDAPHPSRSERTHYRVGDDGNLHHAWYLHDEPLDTFTVPDLDDPATWGCLLALVRKAWGPGFEVVIYIGDGGADLEIRRAGSGAAVVADFHFDSLGLTLAAALLAAPAPAQTGGAG